MTTPRDSDVWNDRELGTLVTLSESLAEGGFEPLTIGSMRMLNLSPGHKSVSQYPPGSTSPPYRLDLQARINEADI